MANCYIIQDKRNKKASIYPIKIAITHQTKTTYIATGYKATESEWDNQNRCFKKPFTNLKRANIAINNYFNKVEDLLEQLRPHWKQLTLKQIKDLATEKIESEIKNKVQQIEPEFNAKVESKSNEISLDFIQYAKNVIEDYNLSDRAGSANVIKSALKSIKRFTKKNTLLFTEITPKFLQSYEVWFLSQYNQTGRPNSVNGLGFYLREVRKIYNLAINDDTNNLAPKHYPFGRYGYSIKKEKKTKRNIAPEEVAKLYDLELTPHTRLWHHRNYFIFSFECRGMNFADIAFLRYHQIEGNRLTYRRRKTRWAQDAKLIEIDLTTTARDILKHYNKENKSSDLVFPILKNVKDWEDSAHVQKIFSNTRSNHITRLKKLGKMAGLNKDINLTSYVGRHSFFTIAQRSGVEVSVISGLAGHGDMKTTEAYLGGFESPVLTETTDKVLQAVKSKQKSISKDDSTVTLKNGQTIGIVDFINSLNCTTSDKVDRMDILLEIMEKTQLKGIQAKEFVRTYFQ